MTRQGARTWKVRGRGIGWLIIRVAWGPRRVTKSKRYGELKSAYPDSLSAAPGLWLRWCRRGALDWLMWRWKVVIPERKAEARIKAALESVEPLSFEEAAPKLSNQQIKELLRDRQELRAQKRFAEADAIRDRLLEAGVNVQDHAIEQEKRNGKRRPTQKAEAVASRGADTQAPRARVAEAGGRRRQGA